GTWSDVYLKIVPFSIVVFSVLVCSHWLTFTIHPIVFTNRMIRWFGDTCFAHITSVLDHKMRQVGPPVSRKEGHKIALNFISILFVLSKPVAIGKAANMRI